MESNIFKYFKKKLIFGKYSIKYLIAKGSFGEVYFGTNKINGKNYALKIEETNRADLVLKEECLTLINLKGPGIPSVISFGIRDKYSILVENLLGKSIKDIWIDKNKKFDLRDTCIFAIQALSRLEYIHSKDYIHRDIKPANFLIGNPDTSQLYLIDFGNARKYRSSRTGKHVKVLKNRGIFGSLVFLSLNSLKGMEQTRRDDLESLGLVIINLYIGSLPWNKTKYKNLKEKLRKIIEMREKLSIEDICKGMPQEMNNYMNYLKNLNYEEHPDYEYLRNLFANLLKKIGVKEHLFSWSDKNISQNKSSSKRKSRSFRNISMTLLEKNINKFQTENNLKLQSKNNEEQKKNTNNEINITKNTETKNKSLADNNLSIQFASKNNTNNCEININTNSEEGIIKNNNNQELKQIKKYKKKIGLDLNNINRENLNKTENNNNKKIKMIRIDKNLNNDELFNKNKAINKFKANINTIKKDENSFVNNKIKNIININNININRNFNKFNNYEYKTIFKDYKSPKLNINISNKIIHMNQLSFNSKNNHSNSKNLNHFIFRQSSYKSIFSNKSPNPTIDLTDRKQNINQIKSNKIEKRVVNKIKFIPLQDSMKHSSKGSYLGKNNTSQKLKYYHPKFISQTEFF